MFLLLIALFSLFGKGYAQNPAVNVFEDWNTTSGTQNNFQRATVRSKGLGGTTYYYVCGSTLNSSGNYDMLLEKKNAAATVLWSHTYNGAGNGDDYAADVQIDNVGNVYICGTYYKNSTDSNNAVLIKYNTAGTHQWTQVFNGAGSAHDGFTAMQLTSDGILVAGTTWQNSTDKYDMIVMRYDTTGSVVWTQNWDYNDLNDIAVNLYSSRSRIYVAGGVQTASTTYQYGVFTVLYSDGSYQGSVTAGGSAFGFDQLTDLQYDDSGYVYLTGGVLNIGSAYDIKTVKLDSLLNTVWSATYTSAGTYNDVGTGLALDSAGNVFVTGYKTSATSGKDYVTIKYSSGGTQRWVSTFDGGINADDSATAIVVNPIDTNKIYVTGFSYNGSTKDYWTLKYDGAGNLKWNIGFNNTANTDDRATSIALDTLGNIIVAGQNKLAWNSHTYTMVKYIEKSTYLADDTISATSTSFVFTENRGQVFGTDTLSHPEVKYYTRAGYPNVYFLDTAVSYVFADLDTSVSGSDSIVRVDMKFKNSNSGQKIRAIDVRSEYSNFFLGHIPEGRSRVQNYDHLVSFNVWNNVDILYGSNLRGLKYYFVCKPGGGGNPATQIDLKYYGADSVKINGSGQLVIYTKLGNIVQPKAAAWQLDGSGNYQSLGWQPSYTLLGTNEVGFTSFGSFNSSLPLIIAVDWGNLYSLVCPTGVVWSTFMGGGSGFDQFHAVKTTAAGDLYVAGETSAINFPQATGYQTTLAGGTDAVVTKIYPDGPIHWSSYYGGNMNSLAAGGAADRAFGVDVDAGGNVYIVGMTESVDFVCTPLGGAYNDNTITAISGVAIDQFIVKLSPNGQTSLWATYYGGNYNDQAKTIQISPISGDIYVGGFGGGGFPLLNLGGAYNSAATSGGDIIKFNSSGARIWATILGVCVESIAIDPNNDVVAVGRLSSAVNFPIQGAYGNTTYGGGQNDGFVTKFYGTSLAVEWSTMYGGNGWDVCQDVVAVQEGANIFYYVVGHSGSTSGGPIPLVQPGFGEYYQGALAGGSNDDGTIAQFHSSGQLFWSTYMGGNNADYFYGVTADSDDNIYLTGYTYSNNFPLPATNAANAFVVSTLAGTTDAIDVSFHKVIHNYVWGTYHGGSMAEIGWDISCEGNSRLYVVGETGALADFPLCQGTTTANGTPYFDGTPDGNIKGFVSDLDLSPVIVAGINAPEENIGSFAIYPNPADQVLYISGQAVNGEPVTIEIVDIMGRVVYSETDQSSGMLNKQIDISNLANGTYIIKVETVNAVSTEKIVIQR